MANLAQKKTRWLLTIEDTKKPWYVVEEAAVRVWGRPSGDEISRLQGVRKPWSREITFTFYGEQSEWIKKEMKQTTFLHTNLTLHLSLIGTSDLGEDVVLERYTLGNAIPISYTYQHGPNMALDVDMNFRYTTCHRDVVKADPLPNECEFGFITPENPTEGVVGDREGIEYI